MTNKLLEKKNEIGNIELGHELNEAKEVIFPYEARFHNTLVLGPTGCGKSRLTILPMVKQDLEWTNGLFYLSPQTDMYDRLKNHETIHRPHTFFNPLDEDSPYFNPLLGDESSVIRHMTMIYQLLNKSDLHFFTEINTNLIDKSLKVIKRLFGENATLLHMHYLISNLNGNGVFILEAFKRLVVTDFSQMKENKALVKWFYEEYYSGIDFENSKNPTKTYDYCIGTRMFIDSLMKNKFLSRVLNPPANATNVLDIEKMLEDGHVLIMTSNQEKLGHLGKFLGYAIIMQLQTAISRRVKPEKPAMLYIDECNAFQNPYFNILLSSKSRQKVALTLTIECTSLINSGLERDKHFEQMVKTNCRNYIVYPGCSDTDRIYLEQRFSASEYFHKEDYMKMDFGSFFYSFIDNSYESGICTNLLN